MDTKQDPILEQLKDRAREAVQASKPRSSDSTQDKGHKIEVRACCLGLVAAWR